MLTSFFMFVHINMYEHNRSRESAQWGARFFDSVMFRDMFGTAEMRAVFADDALIARYIEVEVALARAQSRLGVVPKAAADAIEAAARSIKVDVEKLRHETEIVGYPHPAAGASACGSCGRSRWLRSLGGRPPRTSWTPPMCCRSVPRCKSLRVTCARFATFWRRWRASTATPPMAGRTHLQQALPVTFGYKAAVWLSSIDRHIERVDQALPRILLGEFSGAAGTLASVGDSGLEIQKLFCEELGLHQPPITWHVARDGIAESVTLLGLITGTLGKIAIDVMLMSSSEFGEVSEPFVPGRAALVDDAAEA